MATRTTFAALAGALACGVTVTPAAAADFGISFHYSGCTPRYYAVSSPYYTICTPRPYVYYDDCYYDPAPYVDCAAPRIFAYDRCYPTTYRTTYTRSRYYTRPVRYSRINAHYRTGHRVYHDRKRVTYRRYYAKPRRSIRVYHGDRVSHRRPSLLRHRYRDTYRRHPRLQQRVRIHRR
jgi:hypothetical protein